MTNSSELDKQRDIVFIEDSPGQTKRAFKLLSGLPDCKVEYGNIITIESKKPRLLGGVSYFVRSLTPVLSVVEGGRPTLVLAVPLGLNIRKRMLAGTAASLS